MRSGNQLTPRRSERIYVQMPLSLCVDSRTQSSGHTASTVDFSNNGVRVCADAGLFPGETVEIVTGSGQQRTLPGRIVWVGQVGTRLEGQAGIEFLKPITPPA